MFFHNLKGYDGHLIASEVGKHTANLSAIPQNLEKYISFSFNHFRFLDSTAFLNASLEKLTKNLFDKGKGKDKFIYSKRHCSKPEHLDMLLQKGVYPYDYMSTWDRFSETKLPPKSKFYSKLSESHISAEAHMHGQAVWDAFECSHLGDYHDLYMKTDVLLLADVFENFRQICMESYELDPAHYFTTPNFAWDAMPKKTGVTLELLTDYDMYLMVEQGLRSQNYIAVRGENFKTVCVVDDSVVTIPVSHEYATTTTTDIVQTAELEALPIRYNQRINVNDIGVKVDARTLLTGVIRIVLKDPFSNSPLFRTLATDGTEEWFATLLFVHKP
eukprot:COSAG05_NODE_5063_length_1274_cov_0.869787_2_plen_330_part_00